MRKHKVREYHDKKRPHLKFVVNAKEAGKRVRAFFETKREAETFAQQKNIELLNGGQEAAQFPSALRVMAQNAVELLKPFGKTIMDAAQHYAAHLRASEKSCTATELVKELLKAKEADGVGERHLSDLDYRLRHFAEEFDGKLVAEIRSADIDGWLRSLNVGAQTRNHYRANVLQAFNFAVRHGYAPTNPVEGAAKAKVVRNRPGILTVEQAARLLEAATPEILPFIAIGLFAGLRRAEIERLDWSEVDFESGLIEVKAEKSKTAQRRFVTLQPCLRKWLQPYRKLKGNVVPVENCRELFIEARTAAGIKTWPGNVLRHSAASYHLGHFKNAATTALELGHHDSRITFAHYRELVRPKDAERYWKIEPAARAASKKVVSMAG